MPMISSSGRSRTSATMVETLDSLSASNDRDGIKANSPISLLRKIVLGVIINLPHPFVRAVAMRRFG